MTASRSAPGHCRPARRRRVVREAPLGGRGDPPATAARLRADDQRALFRRPRRRHRHHRRPVLREGARGYASRRAVFVCRPGAGCRRALRATILSRLARRAYRRPVTEQDLERCSVSTGRASPKRVSTRAFSAGCGVSSPRQASLSASSAIPPTPCRIGVSPERHRSRIAALVLLLEQHSGRGTARRRERGNWARRPD